jgi:peptidoglycan/xylan/chitin deacetylase (PgdA/CDA1 family)
MASSPALWIFTAISLLLPGFSADAAAPGASPKPTPEPPKLDAALAQTLVHRGSKTVHAVALTFDVCYNNPTDFDESVVSTLEKTQTAATFFVSGRWAELQPKNFKRLASNPRFEIEGHGYYHPHMDQVTDERLEREMTRMQNAFKKTLGHPVEYVRPPFGGLSDQAIRIAKKHGLTVVLWDFPSGDPDPNISAERMIKAVPQQARNGSIIVFHANKRGVHTAEAIPAIIEKLKAKGFEFKTLEELLGS